MNITILESGFVTGDFLSPVAYAGEINSRTLNIVHPNYENSYYQLIIIKENRPYRLGINNGVALLPPSLIDVAGKLRCCFVALRDPTNNLSSDCNCLPTFSNDCSSMLMKSDEFILTVAEGLNINGLSPIPPYEELVDAYNNLAKAKLAVEQAKLDNQTIANNINKSIEEMQGTGYAKNLEAEILNRQNKDIELENKIKEIEKNTSNRIDDFMNKYFSNCSIKSIDDSIILTNSVTILDNFVLPNDIKLIIPKGMTLKLNKISFIQGELIVGGKIIINDVMHVSGKLIFNDIPQGSIINNMDFNNNKIISYNKSIIDLNKGFMFDNYITNINDDAICEIINNETIQLIGRFITNSNFTCNKHILINGEFILKDKVVTTNETQFILLDNSICKINKYINNWEDLFYSNNDSSNSIIIFNDDESIPDEYKNQTYIYKNNWININEVNN